MPLPVLLSGRRRGSPYPAVANSLLWIDRFNSYTDTAGTTPAGAGNSVWTIRLPSGWGASSGDGLVRQNTSGARPTYRDEGLQGNGTDTNMALPGNVVLAGDYTIYWVMRRASVTTIISAANSSDTKSLISFSDGTYYHWTGGAITAPDAVTGNVIRKVSRTGAGVVFRVGGVNISGTDSETLTINQIITRGSALSTDSANYFNQLVIVGAKLADGSADELAIIAKLQALEGSSWS